MYIEQIYTGCLAEAAYYIESGNEAAIIDPLRDPEPYIELAKKRNANIKYVFETHFHADFVSGHKDLAEATGAEIIYGPTAHAGYKITVAEDGQEFKLGNIHIKVLHTPGHTMESSCFLVFNEDHEPYAVFTGDTLFAGDVGRPDLAVTSDITAEDLASKLYHSLQDKVLTLPDAVIVYPGHGAGSQCGKSLDKETVTTIGKQKAHNYALQVDNEKEFVNTVITGLTAPPQYFPKNAQINKHGAASYEEVFKQAYNPLSPDAFLEECTQGRLILDTRNKADFLKAHLPGSLHIGLDGFFAVWAGTLIEDLDTPILLIAEPETEAETIERLARVGYDHVIGYLEGGFDRLDGKDRMENISSTPIADIDPVAFDGVLLDVRNTTEFEENHLTNAVNIPLAELPERLGEINKQSKIGVYCKSGYRSATASSILQKNGFTQVINLEGGMDALMNRTKDKVSN